MSIGRIISTEDAAFLNQLRLPACLNCEQAAVVLGGKAEHIPILVEGKLLSPLGEPPQNGIKLFAAVDILEKAKDLRWLDKANKYLTRHWQNKNAKARERLKRSGSRSTLSLGNSAN